MNDALLTTTLQFAVPLRIAELLELHGETRIRQAYLWAKTAVDEVACRGDVLQYGGKRGEAAAVFNHLARALAALAMSPGGVTFAGCHWCFEHPVGLVRTEGIGCTASGLG